MSVILATGDRWAMLIRRACPACGCMETARAHRRTLLDEALAAIRLFPYRCSRCSARFRANHCVRALGEKPWSPDPRSDAVMPKFNWPESPLSAALIGTIILALLGATAVLVLLILGRLEKPPIAF